MSANAPAEASDDAQSTEQTPLLIVPSPDEAPADPVDSSVDIESGGEETKLDSTAPTTTTTSAGEKTDTASAPVSPYVASQEDVGGFTKGCYMFFVAVSTLSIIVLACMSISQIILLCKKSVPFLQYSLRLYILIFCLVFILVEFDWRA